MEFKLNKEEILMYEPILSTKQEQAVELDYVLPDYYPEIFKIIKCITMPKIVSYSINGDKLTYDISLLIKILYCSENSNAVQVLEQKMMYSKSADTNRTCINPDIVITPKTDYMNCRAVNQRRIDLRGALTTDINVYDMCKNEVISDAFGMDIQLKKVPVTYPVNRLFTTKQISLNEEFELGLSKPSIDSIICTDAIVASTDKKVIANKMVAKGELLVNMLYTFNNNEETGIESMQFTLPFSQIIELDGIDERFDCFVDAEIMSCDIEPHADSEGNSKIADCNMSLMIKCNACRTSTIELAVDEYSTSYESSKTNTSVNIESAPQFISQTSIIKSSVSNAEINCVYNAQCCLKDYSFTQTNDNIVMNGNAIFTVFACDNEGKPIVIEKEETVQFELQNECNGIQKNISKLKAVPLSCSYNLVSDNTVEIKAEIKVYGTICCIFTVDGLSDIFIDENSPVERDECCAMKLYFADPGENIWDIAKKYRSSVDAVTDENNVDSDIINENRMLIIPII